MHMKICIYGAQYLNTATPEDYFECDVTEVITGGSMPLDGSFARYVFENRIRVTKLDEPSVHLTCEEQDIQILHMVDEVYVFCAGLSSYERTLIDYCREHHIKVVAYRVNI